MTKRAVIYTRVSTDEQAEHGYSLQSQLEACRLYAHRQGHVVVAEKQDDYSGAKLDRPGLDEVREMVRRKVIDAVVVFAPDRLTRNLAHSLILREEWRKAGIELHYCSRGKSEDTAESRMTENIEAVFGDYWREKIIESSRRGRITKAANGKWPCDGHAAYGYRKDGKAREARLAINETEAAVIRRIFTLFAGPDGMPLPIATIAALLTAEDVPPPNRGVGAAKPGMGWHRGTIRIILKRRAYAYGEFSYGGHPIKLPELAIVDPELFEMAQRRLAESGARSVRERKHDYLLVGHFRCSCGMNYSGTPTRKNQRHLYYVCNSKINRRHIKTCSEGVVRVDVGDSLVWEWLVGLLCDEERLEKGLRELTEQQETQLQPKYERLALVVDLIAEAERRIKRLAGAFAEERDEMIAAALRGEMKTAARERDALIVEQNNLRAELVSGKMTEAERKAIKTLAGEVTRNLAAPTFAQKRALMNLLDVRVKLEWREGVKGIVVSCSLKIKPSSETNLTPTQEQSKNLNGKWLSLQGVREKLSSITMM